MGDDKRAPWWREALLPRLRGNAVWAAAPLGLLSGCWDLDNRPDDYPPPPTPQRASAETYETAMDALALQRTQGWNAGQPDLPVAFADASPVDISGTDGWRRALTTLSQRLRPTGSRLQPWYVPTLFQSLLGAPSELLRDSISPIHSREMDEDFARGLAVRGLFEQAGFPRDTAVVVDAPGPRALALAAALADRFDPVFAFGNWPHPLGVVPSHETLAATLYYLPLFEWARGMRQNDAPPVWVLDANRLNPYGDAGGAFDNRYLVKLPSAAELQALGIRHVMYVGSGGRELDDLNAGFVELCAHGVDVRMVSLEDFERGDPSREPPSANQEEAEDEPDWIWSVWRAAPWWYGGDPYWQSCFWEGYHWYHPQHVVMVGPPRGRRGVVIGPPAVVRPAPPSASFTPVPRGTRFTAFYGGGATRAGFGKIPVHASRATGAFVGVSVSGGGGDSGFGRSGSLGRVGGGGFSA